MAHSKQLKDTINAIKAHQEAIRLKIEPALNPQGAIDLIALRETNESLADIFDVITLSKTWRDEPYAFSADAARLLAARETSTELAKALDALEKDLADDE